MLIFSLIFIFCIETQMFTVYSKNKETVPAVPKPLERCVCSDEEETDGFSGIALWSQSTRAPSIGSSNHFI